MEPRPVEDMLREHPFLAGMPREHLAQVASCASTMRIERGEFLFRENEPATASFLIRSGQVGLEIFIPARGPAQVESIGEGGVIGWSWLSSSRRWHFDARAVSPVRAIVLDGERLRAACDRDPALGYELLKRYLQIVGDRVEHLRLQLLDVYGATP